MLRCVPIAKAAEWRPEHGGVCCPVSPADYVWVECDKSRFFIRTSTFWSALIQNDSG